VTPWRRFRSLEARDRRVVAEAAVLLLLVRAGLSILPFNALRRGLRYYAGPARQTGVVSEEHVRRVAWAVTAVALRLPVRTTCLVESLAADAMLRRRGCACDLRFGVRRPQEGSGRFPAHAWIEHRGVVVLGDVDGLRDYAVLSGPGSV
jgi:Transglutaminase-like superfamily